MGRYAPEFTVLIAHKVSTDLSYLDFALYAVVYRNYMLTPQYGWLVPI